MSPIQELVDKLRTDCQSLSIVADLGKKGKLNRFSEESKRTIQKLGKIELCELGNTHLRDYFIAHVVYALCPRWNRKERLKLNLRLCLSRSVP